MKCAFCSNPVVYESLGLCKNPACYEAYDAPRKAANAAALLDPRVSAVRADKAVGEGSCSSIDECYSHAELLASLNEAGIDTPRKAVEWAREVDGGHWENGLNQLCGDDNETDLDIKACVAESRERNNLPIEVD